jgi:AcrR family transcriptional regulator
MRVTDRSITTTSHPGAPSADDAPAAGPSDPPWRRAVERRRRRGSRPPLDRERVIAAALTILDAEGLDAISLRRLAGDLEVTPMSLYWYVEDKAELLDLVGEAILAQIELPPRVGDWKQQIRDVHRAMFDVLLRHPNSTEILIGRARYGSGGLATFERILTVLLDAGLGPEAAFDAYQSLYLFSLGFMATSTRTPEFVEGQRQGLAYMLSLPGDRFPSIRAVAPVIGRRPRDAQFEVGLDVIIEGIAGRLAGRP